MIHQRKRDGFPLGRQCRGVEVNLQRVHGKRVCLDLDTPLNVSANVEQHDEVHDLLSSGQQSVCILSNYVVMRKIEQDLVCRKVNTNWFMM